MRQDMMEDECSRDIVLSKDPDVDEPRALTHDEKKAAEATFRREPFNPAWSVAAAKVYAGILLAMGNGQTAEQADSEVAAECVVGQ